MYKNLIIILLVVLIASFLFYRSFETKTVKKAPAQLTEEKQTVKADVKPKQDLLQRSITKLDVDADLKSLAEQLLPYTAEVMANVWEEEFGCYQYGAIQIPGAMLDSECEHSLLTASSYEEAMWMQRQGYPGKSDIDMLKDPVIKKQIEALANKNFVPATSLMALSSFSDENFKDAASWALITTTYSNKHSTFGYRIRGEAQVAGNARELGLMELRVAMYLGDSEAQFVFDRYALSYPRAGIMAVDHANLYMSRVFGVPFDQYPSDPRPVDGEGG